MRRTVLAALACALAAPAALPAQAARVKIEAVRVGFPAGPHSREPTAGGETQTVYKSGSWCPVAVSLTGLRPLEADSRLVVETADSEDMRARTAVPIAGLDANKTEWFTAYVKPGDPFGELTVTVVDAKGRDVSERPFRLTLGGRDPSQFVFLTAGSKLPDMQLPGAAARKDAAPGSAVATPVSVACATDVGELPTSWFTYGTVDLVILATSNREFVTALQNDRDGRAAALAEWVSRGGQLVVCAGQSQAAVAGLGGLAPALPAKLSGARSVAEVRPYWETTRQLADRLSAGAGKTLELAGLEPRADRAARVLARAGQGGEPLVVQGAYGAGRVTLVGLDLDARPFTAWERRGDFWSLLLRAAGPVVEFGGGTNPGWQAGPETDLASAVQNHVEAFEDAPVISFGWVALFIFVYILIVGPLDYFFLKKVVKRMELTWVTFPAAVIIVSAAAYVTAYTLKGNDLRVRKVDAVDIDLHTNQARGAAFFSVFSPRIQNYTVSVEPTAAWASPADGERPGAPLVSWLGRARNVQKSLFARGYDYAPGAAGLVDVPIQVWSTKDFVATWQAPLPPGQALVDGSQLAARGERLGGTLTSHLPGPLLGAKLFYRDRLYDLGDLYPDATKPMPDARASGSRDWLKGETPTVTLSSYNGRSPSVPAHMSLWPVLFAERCEFGKGASVNGSLRELDQSWRLSPDNPGEAVLVGKLADEAGAAAEVAERPTPPTRLWLSGLPGGGRVWTAYPGRVRQEVYVRAFLPVAPTGR